MAVCHYHPDRTGIGICMRCRVVICSSCTTKVDGVNHCHACLKKLAAPETAAPRPILTPVLAAGLLLGAAWLVLFGIGWLLQGTLAP